MERFLIMSLKTLFPKKALGIGIGALWEGHFSAHQKYQQLSLNKKNMKNPWWRKKTWYLVRGWEVADKFVKVHSQKYTSNEGRWEEYF